VPRESVITSIIHAKDDLPVPQILDFIAATRSGGATDANFEMEMAGRCAGRDPFAAADFFAQPPAGGAKNDYKGWRVVVSQWAQVHPEAAESWAKGQEGTPHYGLVANMLAQAARDRNDLEAEQRWRAAAAPK
jgi:hypothetical protein